jgi:hypothetical protein
MVVTLDEQASRRHGHLPMPIKPVWMLIPIRGRDGFQDHLRSHGHRSVDDESKSHVIHLEAPNRRLFVELADRSLNTYAPSCDCYGEASRCTIIVEFPINGGIVVSSDNRCAAMGAEWAALSSGNQSIVPGTDIEWVEEFSAGIPHRSLKAVTSR